MPSALFAAAIAGIAVAVANAGFGVLAANIFVDAGYKFKAATWWIWLLVGLIGCFALFIASVSSLGVFIALWRSGLLASLPDVAKGFIWIAMWLAAVFSFSAGYRLTVRHRMLRILDRGIAVGLH